MDCIYLIWYVNDFLTHNGWLNRQAGALTGLCENGAERNGAQARQRGSTKSAEAYCYVFFYCLKCVYINTPIHKGAL